MNMLTARSEQTFPTLARVSHCLLHDDCTPMDCENFHRIEAQREESGETT